MKEQLSRRVNADMQGKAEPVMRESDNAPPLVELVQKLKVDEVMSASERFSQLTAPPDPFEAQNLNVQFAT